MTVITRDVVRSFLDVNVRDAPTSTFTAQLPPIQSSANRSAILVGAIWLTITSAIQIAYRSPALMAGRKDSDDD